MIRFQGKYLYAKKRTECQQALNVVSISQRIMYQNFLFVHDSQRSEHTVLYHDRSFSS